jgi:hypothetical protein
MGFDLQVLASNSRAKGGELVTTANLRFDRDMRLLSQLARDANPCLVHPLADGLKVGHYRDDGLRFEDVDAYGKQLTYTTPADLKILQTPIDLVPWNQAILAFLTALPPDARLFLYWC